MDRSQLFASLAEAPLNADDIVYVERRGTQYSWALVTPGTQPPASTAGADVWMYFSGSWPQDDPVGSEAFCADMLAEMESMAGGDDRCRWPLDQPWPQLH
jgi:hypothetical protein